MRRLARLDKLPSSVSGAVGPSLTRPASCEQHHVAPSLLVDHVLNRERVDWTLLKITWQPRRVLLEAMQNQAEQITLLGHAQPQCRQSDLGKRRRKPASAQFDNREFLTEVRVVCFEATRSLAQTPSLGGGRRAHATLRRRLYCARRVCSAFS